MFAKNVGGLDKTLRIVVGALLVLAFFLTDGPYSPLYLLGIIPLVTGLLGTCPIYSLIGVNTCPMKK
ncbi:MULTISPECIES: YgaP family membrane protein [Salipiger]|uniref:Inner membrane protein YgaP-like transmembrane domain-containing protein n=1 Tax=Salipiger bermudensis (strain DSM 26914 / JCM 13377 / KCTC 12554 / HTCC2601) TaxID=314265 RepID=Q0FJN2_SALBH|nr:DUF2892 domain-containing protein [Salipiger bermudensis]EAU44405.1 hypothetical protein R2601_25686 [Salipiger bermudensis HTCC2601]MBN9674918.1 DUF2892 domain-containing protein [Salipiger bermudensis]MCA1284559.1 DUF2892 domain-containing protein [Salipiger bermudensis]|tara:strand:- start:173 stop:373 length:201 start_codon:yes stop_codon:yes gene_type:complete